LETLPAAKGPGCGEGYQRGCEPSQAAPRHLSRMSTTPQPPILSASDLPLYQVPPSRAHAGSVNRYSPLVRHERNAQRLSLAGRGVLIESRRITSYPAVLSGWLRSAAGEQQDKQTNSHRSSHVKGTTRQSLLPLLAEFYRRACSPVLRPSSMSSCSFFTRIATCNATYRTCNR
jgi:hypothetical protein